MADPLTLRALRATIQSLETPLRGHAPHLSLGVPEIDAALPNRGLPLARLHHLTGGMDGFSGPLLAFTARLAGRLCRQVNGPALWIVSADSADDTLNGPGLEQAGLSPGQLIIVRVGDDSDILWSMEEALRCPSIGVVIGNVRQINRTAGRRLQLAAEHGGVTAFLLPSQHGAGWQSGDSLVAATTATTRWRITSAESAPVSRASVFGPAPGQPRWTVTLERCQGGMPRSWLVELNDETGDLAVVSTLPDRSAEPPGRRLA